MTNQFPVDSSGKESACQRRRLKRCRFSSWVRKIPWRRTWQPTLVFLPGESHGQSSLESYSLWGGKELDTTEVTQDTKIEQRTLQVKRIICSKILGWEKERIFQVTGRWKYDWSSMKRDISAFDPFRRCSQKTDVYILIHAYTLIFISVSNCIYLFQNVVHTGFSTLLI